MTDVCSIFVAPQSGTLEAFLTVTTIHLYPIITVRCISHQPWIQVSYLVHSEWLLIDNGTMEHDKIPLLEQL